jgi:hypothetical protein
MNKIVAIKRFTGFGLFALALYPLGKWLSSLYGLDRPYFIFYFGLLLQLVSFLSLLSLLITLIVMVIKRSIKN